MTPWPETWTWERDQGREWPALVREFEQVMVRHSDGKNPFAPWGERDHPDYAPDDPEKDDARYAWSIPDQWGDFETARQWADMDPSLAPDCVFILQRESDPYREPADPGIFIDGDDVRDTETGGVHPAWPFLLAFLFPNGTYADISTSETGGHAMGHGALPDGVKQLNFELPYHPDFPDAEVEIYDGKRVCVATGKHVAGTPEECRPIDHEALETIVDAHGPTRPERREPADAYEEFDAEEYTPTATESTETTDDIRDVFAALDRINAQHVAADTIVHRWNDDASTSAGNRAFIPTWGTNANGTANIVDQNLWQDTGGDGYGGPVVMALVGEKVLASDGERPESTTPTDVRGATWFHGVELLRELGYEIPEYTGRTGDAEHVPILPNTPIERARRGARSTWDWRGGTDALTTEDVRERTLAAIASAYERGDRVLVDAVMSSGKSYGAIKAAADTDEPITFLTGRGRDEQYEQIQEWCDKHGLSSVILPTISDCGTYSGRYADEHEHAEHQKRIVRRWYDAGATGKDIHMHAEDELGQPLVCDGPVGARCTYKVRWEALDPDDYDVLIGHYNHAHVGTVVQGRTLVFDEFPEDAYLTDCGPSLPGAVSSFLRRYAHVDELPDDYADLMEVRTDDARRADALAWFLDHAVERDGTLAFEESGRAHAPIATFALLAAAENDLGNGFERATLLGQYGDREGDGVGVYDREDGSVRLLTPPDIRYAAGVVALDGTPVPELWDIVLGARLNHRQVLTDGERAEYVRDSQNIDIIRTTEYVKPYSGSPDNVHLEEDRALLREIGDRHGEKPDLITTQTAEKEVYEPDGDILDLVAEREHHGNVKGSNKFANSRLGIVIGSRHYGDRYVQQWGALAGECVERGDGRGVELEYSGIGAAVHRHMTHHETMQAVMRFGRDGNGATVYVHTNTLPNWTPLAGIGAVERVWSDGMKQVLDAARDLDEWRTAEIANHPAVEIGERQVRAHLHTLVDRDVVAVEIEGRGFVWRDDGLHRVNEDGDIQLPTVEPDELTDTEVAELGRVELYTWDFRNFADSPADQAADRPGRRGDQPSIAAPPDASLPTVD